MPLWDCADLCWQSRGLPTGNNDYIFLPAVWQL